MNPNEVYNENDPIFPGYYSLNGAQGDDKFVNSMPEEMRKLYNPMAFPEA
jgi:hypothetical protein